MTAQGKLAGMHEVAVTDLADSIMRDGFAVRERVLDAAAIDAWCAAVERALNVGHQPDSTTSATHAARNLLMLPAVRALAASSALGALVEAVLGSPGQAVRGILFNKVAEANWKVAWHQDRAIAVEHRLAVPGFGPWSVKQDVVHVEPPAGVLERMVTLRLHLDDCSTDNGPLRVVPGSHRRGKLDAPSIARLHETGPVTTCTVSRGGVLLMRPLLLHASSPAIRPTRRRVVHLEYAADPLPGGLEWRAWGDRSHVSGG